MHLFVEAELLAVERDRGIDVVDDVADAHRGHDAPPPWSVPCLPGHHLPHSNSTLLPGVVGRAAAWTSARGEDAELVALGVAEDDPADVALADVGRLGAESAEAGHLGAVVVV